MDEWLDELTAALGNVELRLDHLGAGLLPIRPDVAGLRARREWRDTMDALVEVITRVHSGYDIFASAVGAARSSLAEELLGRDEMRRRDLLRVTGMLSAAAILPPDLLDRVAQSPPARVDRGVLDAYADATASYARGFYIVAPGDLLAVVRGHVDRLAALGDAPTSPGLRQRWNCLLSDAAGLAGELALDADRRGEARAYFGLAHAAAEQAGEATLQAVALADLGLVHAAQYGGDARASAWYLTQAAQQLPADAPDYLRAWLHAQAAKEAAAAGDDYDFFAAMEVAQQALERQSAGRPRDGFWSDQGCFSLVGQPGWLQRFQGRGLAYLGRDEAGETLNRSLAEASRPHDVAALAHASAEWHMGRDEPEQAAVAAIKALGVIPIWTARVLTLRHRLQPWSDLPAVRDLDEALALMA